MKKDKVILTYSSAVEIYWINWMLPINVHSQHHEYKKDYIKISPARYIYYDMMADNIIEANVGSEGTINKEEFRKAITILKSEDEAGHECNIDNMTQ